MFVCHCLPGPWQWLAQKSKQISPGKTNKIISYFGNAAAHRYFCSVCFETNCETYQTTNSMKINFALLLSIKLCTVDVNNSSKRNLVYLKLKIIFPITVCTISASERIGFYFGPELTSPFTTRQHITKPYTWTVWWLGLRWKVKPISLSLVTFLHILAGKSIAQEICWSGD